MPKKKCPHCGAEMNPYKVHLTPMMIHALVKFRQAVMEKGENSVHLLNDMKGKPFELTRHEWNNFTRQRFLALAVKDKNNSGHWILTRRGAEFLNGLTAVPKYVLVLRNRIVERSPELVYVKDIMKADIPYMENIHDIEYVDLETMEEAREELQKHSVPLDGKRPYKMVIGDDNIARKVYTDEVGSI